MVALLFTPGVVVEKMKGGADLMTPGLANRPPFPSRAVKGSIVGIADYQKPSVPVAVGVCEIDVANLDDVRGAKGVAVTNVHWAGDELYNFSANNRPAPQIPDKLDGWEQWLLEQEAHSKTANLTIEDNDEGGVALGDEQKAPERDESVADKSAADLPPLTQKEVDDVFRNAFLYGVHHHKETNTDKNHGLSFPLSQSLVMSNLVQPFLPAFTPEQSQQLQIKKTSWKNIKKFIKSLDKEKIVKSKEKDGHETVILDIDFEDIAITTFRPYRLPKKETAAGTSQGRVDLATDQIDTGDNAIGQKLEIKTFYKPTAKLSPVFLKSESDLLSAAAVRTVITTYIEDEKLVSETNKRLVKLDPTLANAVFDGTGALDKEVIAKGSVPRDALIDRILHSMSTSYVILKNGADPTSVKARSGAPPKIQIVLETRSGNKTVTKVSGLEAYHIRPRPLADELRKVCAGSTSVEPLAGATKKNEKPIEEVMIQGPQKDAVIKALDKRGVNARYIEVVDKTKGKKK
ncbi:hypothetical protein AMS68_007179 [Peltaster fructicola]|uniref:SUI1 domain-containing protein n=1 Tax=Peltaster fructicola TaxID=286661 RepID=A0A6H0Y3R1_9PEZI|nr:hypothetical protein AMS68_007179 [Peltaster fructicola]